MKSGTRAALSFNCIRGKERSTYRGWKCVEKEVAGRVCKVKSVLPWILVLYLIPTFRKSLWLVTSHSPVILQTLPAAKPRSVCRLPTLPITHVTLIERWMFYTVLLTSSYAKLKAEVCWVCVLPSVSVNSEYQGNPSPEYLFLTSSGLPNVFSSLGRILLLYVSSLHLFTYFPNPQHHLW